jgi:hypothetical protein
VAGTGAGGNIEIHLDSSSGTLIGTCLVPGTGGAQNYVDAYCGISAATGNHTVYLVYTGGAGNLFNVEYFGFYATSPALSYQLVPGNTYSLLALTDGKYVTAVNTNDSMTASGLSVGAAQEFMVVDQGGGNISLLAQGDGEYVCADNNGASPLIANRTGAGSWETYTEYAAPGGNIALRAMNNGEFVTAQNTGSNLVIASSSVISTQQSFTVGFVAGAAPAAPNGLTATPDNSRVALNWVPSTGATGYNVKYSTSNGGAYTVIATNLAATSFLQTGLVNGTTYYYVVSATNAAGESANSSQVIATPGTLNRLYWVASSSTTGGDSPANALDGNLTTRWSTDASQTPGQWFEVDLGVPCTFSQLVLNSVNSANDYPRGYQVYVSADGVNWGSAVATGTGTSTSTTITFPIHPDRQRRWNLLEHRRIQCLWHGTSGSHQPRGHDGFQQRDKFIMECER